MPTTCFIFLQLSWNAVSAWECSGLLCASGSGLYPTSSNLSPSLWCGPPLQHYVSPLTFTSLLSFQTFLLSWALSPIFSRFPASHSSFDCQLALLAAASFFDPPLLTQSLNTFNLLSSFLICHSIHPVLPFIISPYLPLPSVLLLAVSLSEGWIQGSSFSILSITHTHIPHALTAKCVCRLHMLILIYACSFVISCFCMKLLCVHSCQCV